MRGSLTALMLAGLFLVAPTLSMEQTIDARAPDVLIQDISKQVLATLRANPSIKSADPARVNALIDELISPHTDFARTTQATLGRYWAQATPDQRRDLEREFRNLLVLVYAGGLRNFGNQTMQFRAFRGDLNDDQVVVRTYVVNKGEPIQVDYRLYKSATGWKIFDVNVAGLWLTEAYRSQFAPLLDRGGVTGLLKDLREKNASLARNPA